mmetsp:Transcript_32138/g.31451  ORF Transcript_32138/g.31451 Transcript_32138/m.31451 type:complete len:180 (+) Transcript_32138:334-873(+)
MLSLKSILKACENYLEQSDFENRDFFNKSKLDKILDQIRDAIYSQKIDIKQQFMKLTESDSENYDKSVMTLEQFSKFIRHSLGDKLSTRELEQVYKNIVNKKPLQFKRFHKVFSHKQVSSEWFVVGVKILRDYIVRKKLTSTLAFEKFLMLEGQVQSGKLNKYQIREAFKKEQLPFTYP